MPLDPRRAKHISYKMTDRTHLCVDVGHKVEDFFPSEHKDLDAYQDVQESRLEERPQEAPPTKMNPMPHWNLRTPRRRHPQSPSPSPPILLRFSMKECSNENDNQDFIEIYGLRIDEEGKQKEEERQMARERQKAEAKRHERFIEMMMMLLCGGSSLNRRLLSSILDVDDTRRPQN